MRPITFSRSGFGDGIYTVRLLNRWAISLQFKVRFWRIGNYRNSFAEMDARTKKRIGKIYPFSPWFSNGNGVVFDPENYGVISVETYKRKE